MALNTPPACARNILFILFLLLFMSLFTSATALACKYTPLPWQQPVASHPVPGFVGQNKHTSWMDDRNRNFIDDMIEARYGPGDRVNVTIALNRCLPPPAIQNIFSSFGRITYIGKLVTFIHLAEVRFEDLDRLAALREVAMVELHVQGAVSNDNATRAVQSRRSTQPTTAYFGESAEDLGFTGEGVRIAILDNGVDNAHAAFAGKPVIGFDAIHFQDWDGNNIDDDCEGRDVDFVCSPNDDTGDPDDEPSGHGTHVAGIALGSAVAEADCRGPADEDANCAGVAQDAELVDVKVCSGAHTCPDFLTGLDWVGLNAARLNIRVVNMSLRLRCNTDGSDVLSQQIDYLSSVLGVAVIAAHGNANEASCESQDTGDRQTGSPGSTGLAITVAATNDEDSVDRSDDTLYSSHLTGPRDDFDPAAPVPNRSALKPDIAAPGEGIYSADAGTASDYVSMSGTSQAAPVVAGAAAVVLEARPDLDPVSLKQLLQSTADSSANVPAYPAVDPIWDNARGAGMLNVHAALEAAEADPGFPSCVGPPPEGWGKPCALSSGEPWENTMDIWTDAPPEQGVPNTIFASVHNPGTTPVTVLVNFGVYDFAIGNPRFHDVGTQQVTIPSGRTVEVSMPWTPVSFVHQCMHVRIGFGGDSNLDNNVTQRNFWIEASEYKLRVENPYLKPADFRVALQSERTDWQCEIDQTNFTIDPLQDCPKQLTVRFNPPAGALPGERADCRVAVYATLAGQENEPPMRVGGVTVQTFVPEEPRPLWLFPLIVIIVALVVFYYIRRAKGQR